MAKMIRCGIRVFFRRRSVWLTLLAALLLGIFAGLLRFTVDTGEETVSVLAPFYFLLTRPVILLLMMFTVMHCIREEMHEGTIRNRFFSGCSKRCICGAYLGASLCFSLVTALVYLTAFFATGRESMAFIPAAARIRWFLLLTVLFLFVGAASCLFRLLFPDLLHAAAFLLSLTGVLFFAADKADAFLNSDYPPAMPEAAAFIHSLNPVNAYREAGQFSKAGVFYNELYEYSDLVKKPRAVIREDQEKLNALSGRSDPDSLEKIRTLEREIADAEQELHSAAEQIRDTEGMGDELRGYSLRMLAVLTAFCAVCLLLLKRRDFF